MNALRKPKNQRSKRILKAREPKLVEVVKSCLLMRGTTTNNVMTSVLHDIHQLRKPFAKVFSKRNEKRPFEDETSCEFLCTRNDASLFAFASDSKKRPNNLVLGRLFDGHILDMYELAISNFKPMLDFADVAKKSLSGGKPCFVFEGEAWNTDTELSKLMNILLDFFTGRKVDVMNLAAMDHVIVCTIGEGKKVLFRNYFMQFKKSGGTLPRVELEEMGPRMDLEVRRTRLPSKDLLNSAMKESKHGKPAKVKNVKRDGLGSTVGRVHMKSQDLTQLQTRKIKGLKKTKGEGESAEAPEASEAPAKKRRVAAE
jgi:ribosome production factor 2